MKNLLSFRSILVGIFFVVAGLIVGSIGFVALIISVTVWNTSVWSGIFFAILAMNGLSGFIYLLIQQLRWEAKEIEKK